MHLQWVAHRGECEKNLENTLASITAAIDAGITAIEIDVQLTKDGIPVLFHDDNLMRMTGINKPIAAVDFKTLSQLPLKPNNSVLLATDEVFIPSLQQIVLLIKKHPNITFFVEVKEINFSSYPYKTVYKNIINILQPIIEQAVLISFSYRFLRMCRQNSKQAIAYVLPSWRHYSDKMLTRLNPEFIFCDTEIIPDNHIFSETEYTWVLYEIKNEKMANHFIKRGITHMETFTSKKLSRTFAHLNEK